MRTFELKCMKQISLVFTTYWFLGVAPHEFFTNARKSCVRVQAAHGALDWVGNVHFPSVATFNTIIQSRCLCIALFAARFVDYGLHALLEA
jgi:hypothetical protein